MEYKHGLKDEIRTITTAFFIISLVTFILVGNIHMLVAYIAFPAITYLMTMLRIRRLLKIEENIEKDFMNNRKLKGVRK